MDLAWWWYRTLRFRVEGHELAIRTRALVRGLVTELSVDGVTQSIDHTPLGGPDSVRNHRHSFNLPSGGSIEIEAGYISLWAMGAIVRREGAVVYETHPGRTVAYPASYRDISVNSPFSGDRWRTNRLPLTIDLLSGLLFFVVGKFFGLQSAALVAAAVGVSIVLGEKLFKRDLTGGLALFGIVMLLISAGFAWAFQDEAIIKMRGTFTGLLASALFLGDGLFGGRWLAGKLMRYLPWTDMHAGRLGIGMGLAGLIMAGLNFGVARLASTDTWLVYTTFLDTPIFMGLFLLVISYARGRLFSRGQAQGEATGA
jgi:intracellular septation protein A